MITAGKSFWLTQLFFAPQKMGCLDVRQPIFWMYLNMTQKIGKLIFLRYQALFFTTSA